MRWPIGIDIQIKMFDDRIMVESPGDLPGIVRLDNMRQVHFSRNPKIAVFLHEYDYVQEFGEGVDRIYRELEAVGMPEPEYTGVSFMLHVTVWNRTPLSDAVESADNVANDVANDVGNVANDVGNAANDVGDVANGVAGLTGTELCIYQLVKEDPGISTTGIAEELDVSVRTVQRHMAILKKKGFLDNAGSRKRIRWVILK